VTKLADAVLAEAIRNVESAIDAAIRVALGANDEDVRQNLLDARAALRRKRRGGARHDQPDA